MENFGDRLRRIRGDRSQREVAKELGMPPTTLSSLENQDSIPRGEVLQKLAEYFRVPLNYFYEPQSSNLTSTDAARNFLLSLKQPLKGRETVATNANIPVDDAVRQRIAERIKERLSDAEDKR
jgi:transcriptional regulator with XRE-family HTH domain